MDIRWRIVPVWGHYELFINGLSYCTADTYEEAYNEYLEYERETKMRMREHSYMMIEVGTPYHRIADDVLGVFQKRGYFKPEEIEVKEHTGHGEYWYHIVGLSSDSAFFIGDILEACLGRTNVVWSHIA